LLQLRRFDRGLGGGADGDRERNVVAAGRDVVIVDREGEAADLPFLWRLVMISAR
jgi:hypothetical protein